MVLKIIIGVVLGCFVAFEIYDLVKAIINKKKQKSNTNQNEINKENEK